MRTNLYFPRSRGNRRLLAAATTGVLTLGALTACSADTSDDDTADTTSPIVVADNTGLTASDALADNLPYDETVALADQTWDAVDEVTISLDGASATVSSGAVDGVQVDGSTVTVTKPGNNRVSGTLADGGLVVASPDDGVVRLVLDGADITSSTGAALAVTDADQVSVVLAEGSTNRLEDATTYADTTSDNAPNAALYSTADLAISGSGALEVVGNANDGITGKDGLVVAGGDLTVTAADDAVRGKDYLVVTGGSITADAGGDGLKSDADDDAAAGYVALLGGTVTVSAGSDGVQGFTDVAVVDGELTVLESEEGIEAATIAVSGGTVDVTASDDGLNATVKEAEDETSTADSTDDTAGDAADGAAEGPGGGGGDMAVQEGESLTVTDGSVRVRAGADAYDSNGVIVLSGGTSVLEAAAGGGGEGALDANGTVTVSGATVLTSGNASVGAVEGEADWVMVSLDAAADAGSEVTVAAADGTELSTFSLAGTTSSVAFTSPEVTAGESYTVTVGDTTTTVAADDALAGSMGGGLGGQLPGGPGGGQPPSGEQPPSDA